MCTLRELRKKNAWATSQRILRVVVVEEFETANCRFLVTAERHIAMRLPVATASIFLGCALAGATVDVSPPGEEGLHKLYGNPTMERFAVRSGITLTVEYGPDRIACQLLIAPAQALIE